MKYLVVCGAGNSRSACMARVIKKRSKYKDEAIAMGVCVMSQETVDYFANWADKIIDMSDEFSRTMYDEDQKEKINRKLEAHKTKVLRAYIGGDKWGNPFHPELTTICELELDRLQIEEANKK